jgi:hypothetical protein
MALSLHKAFTTSQWEKLFLKNFEVVQIITLCKYRGFNPAFLYTDESINSSLLKASPQLCFIEASQDIRARSETPSTTPLVDPEHINIRFSWIFDYPYNPLKKISLGILRRNVWIRKCRSYAVLRFTFSTTKVTSFKNGVLSI